MVKTKVVIPQDNHSKLDERFKTFIRELSVAAPQLEIVRSRSALPSRSRNEGIIGGFTNLRHPGDLLLHDLYITIDCDVVPDTYEFIRSIDSMNNFTLATGLYKSRGTEKFAAGEIEGQKISSINAGTDKLPDTVGWAGGGLLFIGKSWLMKIDYPYFHEGVINWVDRDGIHRGEIIGEDVAFCRKLNNVGGRFKVIKRLIADHITVGYNAVSSEKEKV